MDPSSETINHRGGNITNRKSNPPRIQHTQHLVSRNGTSRETEKASDSSSLINWNPRLQAYYGSLESRIGYRFVLGGTRHFGYWEHDTYWPFPLTKGLRAMEDKLAEALDLPKGSQ